MTAFPLQTPWLDRTGWDRTYSSRGRREVLTALTRTFISPGGRDYYIGHGQQRGLDEDFVSSGEDEDRIACLVRLVDVMISRCEETARRTSRHMLCWLRSTQASSIYSKPFTLVQPTSSTKYRLLLKRCLAMTLRIYRLPHDKRLKVTGLALNRKQLQFLNAIWNHGAFTEWAALEELAGRYKHSAGYAQAAVAGRGDCSQGVNGEEEEEREDEDDGEEDLGEITDDDEYDTEVEAGEITDDDEYDTEVEAGAAPGSPEELVELLFGLTLALATQPVVDGQPQTTVLVYFSGILGFSSSSGGSAFLPARSYTSNLSGLIYILRLVFLEYALPLQSYPTLDIERRPRVGQLERLQLIRRQYMVMESQSPMEELLSLRNYGQVIARTDTPPHLLRWSDNGQVVSLGDEISVSMSQFRRLPERFIKEAATLCNEMMFAWDPAIDLANITDDVTNNKEGFSFVLHPRNKLDKAYLELVPSKQSPAQWALSWQWLGLECCLSFRQICIGITEKHVREVYQSFNRFDDRSADARRNVAFAWQSGHRPLQRASTYGLDGAFPTKLQPQLLELYRWASSRWHEFLHLPSFLKHTPRIEDPFQRNARSSPLSGPQVREGRQASTPIVVLSSPSSSDQDSDAPESTSRRSLTQPIASLSSIPQQRSTSIRCDRQDDPRWEFGEFEREQQEMIARFRRMQEEVIEIRNHHLPSKRRPDYQRQGLEVVSLPPKRKRTLPPSFTGQNIPDQPPDNDIRRHWPLFGHPGSSTTTSAINKRQAILNHLDDQATFKKGDEDYQVHMKLRCKVGIELEKWASVGCQLCYALEDTGLDHNLENCTATGSKAAQRILSWLETLHLERYHANTEEEKNQWTDKYMSATGPDGFCENKPAIRRTIAALCTVDDQILGKALISFISKTYNTDITLKSQATKWFEEKVPLKETWVPQLLLAFDLLVRAFEFLSCNGVGSSRGHGTYDSSPSGPPEAPSLHMSWGDSEEVKEWKVVMDWWIGKCSFCAGRGVKGSQIQHTLRHCPHGGKQVLSSELAEAIYEEGFRARGGCRKCALPREVCQAWEQNTSGEWCFHHGLRCQYGSQAYDTAIGFFFCKNSRYGIELMESMSEEDLDDLDEESVAVWLGKKITVTSVEASEIMKQLRWWSQMV
ncbi:hypothetical protein FPRO05_14224 [Fusarium proliferatum]|uniref:Uncharacterized protein n=1 Tax=Gibberella intermedia TaxID=948311 RepID=A0A365MTA3_GIBIN|nr:hypothetical protein FPRO05_14224 [Fusarium proliferatum]